MPKTSDVEQLLRCTDYQSFYISFQKPLRDLQEAAITMDVAIEMDNESCPSNQVFILDVPLTIYKFFLHPLFRTSINEMTLEGSTRMSAFEIDILLIKIAKDTHP